MNNLLSVLKATIKAKITPIWTKLKYWTSASFIKTRVTSKIRENFSKVLSVRPRHKKDYYRFFGLLISRRLAHAILLVLFVVSLWFLVVNNPFVNIKNGLGIDDQVYKYNSIPLRFVDSEVKIKAKSGYIAYEGHVEKGYCCGQGKLMDEEGRMVYEGDFDKNKYNGQGTEYYVNGQAKYIGQFTDNLYNGKGSLYREGGTKIYEGDFRGGLKEGTGDLYDPSEAKVFSGSFKADDIVYAQLLGKSASDISGMYTGKYITYTGGGSVIMMLDDINAFYSMPEEDDTVSGEVVSKKVFVGKDEFAYGTESYDTLTELKAKFGKPLFEGKSYATIDELVGIDWLNSQGRDIKIDTKCMYEDLYEDLIDVTEFNPEAEVYLHVYEIDGILYTFVAQDKGDHFFMYYLG